MNRYAKLCLVTALILSLGGHWHVLQVLAWAKMMQERVPTMGVSEALTSVFGGVEPCDRCLTIREHRDDRNDSPASLLKSGKKIEIFCSNLDGFVPVRQPLIATWQLERQVPGMNAWQEIPKPPPRLV